MGSEDEITPEDAAEAGARDALHEGHPEEFSFAEIKQHLNVPDRVEGNEHYVPLQRLQRIWEIEIESLGEGPEKEEMKTLYDNRAQELFAGMIINLADKSEAENQQYQPVARLAAISEAIRDFPFARAEAMEKMFDLVDKKKKELGIEKLYAADGETEV